MFLSLSRASRLSRLSALALSLLLAYPALLHADDLPDLGDVSQNELSPAMEKQIGQKVMNEIRQDPSFLDDPEVTTYLNQVGGRLAAACPDPGYGFIFFAMKDPTINAFATYGGYVGVNTGLLLAAQSESELAGVLAHELSHVTQHHLARGITTSKQQSIAAMVAMGLALLAARNNPQVAGGAMAATQAAAVQSQLAYSRDYEREADRIGFQTLQKAGFDPRAMGEFFSRLAKATRVYENNAPAYLRTHPLTTERIADMENRAQNAHYKQVPDSLDFQLIRAKLRAQQGTPADAVADFTGLLKEKKFSSEAATHYGLAQAQLRARDFAGAEKELQTLRRLKAASPLVENLAASLRSAQGDGAGAASLLRAAMKTYPGNAALIYAYGDALYAEGQYSALIAFLDNQRQYRPQDYRLYGQEAKTYSAMGRHLQQHRAQAEYYALLGQTAQAIEQLQLAQQAGDGNFYELSMVDARLRELRRRQQDEMKDR